MVQSLEIPQTLIGDVRAALASLAVFQDARPQDWLVEPLSGLTNRTFLVSHGNSRMVVRLPPCKAALSIDREAERNNLSLAAALGLAPAVVHMDVRTGLLVTNYMAGCRALGSTDFTVPTVQTRVAGVLRTLQASRVDFLGRQDPQTAIDRYLASHADPIGVELRRALAPVLTALTATKGETVPAHVDPHPGNFMVKPDGFLVMVDWEFSALADPFWDIAAVLNAMPDDLSVRARVAFAGLGDASPPTMSRLQAFQGALLLVAGSWAAMEAAARNDPDLADMARMYLSRCRAWLAEGRMAGWPR